MNRNCQKPFHVKGNKLFIGGAELKSHTIVGELGSGMNGIVYHAKNNMLGRDEALKVWRASKSSDRRDKLIQGLLEAQKLARVSPEYAVTIYSAQELNGVFFAAMEYVKGQTLKWYQENANFETRLGLARVYLSSIILTSSAATRHGDAHAKNVMVYEVTEKHNPTALRIKLCDFGTSHFSGVERSEERHWKIVKDTLLSLTHSTPHRDFCAQALNRDWHRGGEMAADAYKNRKKGIDFTDEDIANMWSAPLRDYLNDLRDINR